VSEWPAIHPEWHIHASGVLRQLDHVELPSHVLLRWLPIGFGRFHQLVTEGLCNGGVRGELRWHVDVLIARGKAKKAESRGDGGAPAEKLANEGRHAVDRSEHDRGLILIGIGGIDEDQTGDFGREAVRLL